MTYKEFERAIIDNFCELFDLDPSTINDLYELEEVGSNLDVPNNDIRYMKSIEFMDMIIEKYFTEMK